MRKRRETLQRGPISSKKKGRKPILGPPSGLGISDIFRASIEDLSSVVFNLHTLLKGVLLDFALLKMMLDACPIYIAGMRFLVAVKIVKSK